MFLHDKHFQATVIEHSSLLGQFESYEENDVLWLGYKGEYSQLLIFS